MTEPRERISFEALDRHDRASFACGVPVLDRYLAEQASQDARRRVARCFVAAHGTRVLGFYTLAATNVALSGLPPETVSKLPRYAALPAVLIGRLAVALDARGEGIGGLMLMDATARVLASDIAAYALLVDAKDEAAAAFYRHHGFMDLQQQLRTLFLPLATAERSLAPRQRG